MTFNFCDITFVPPTHLQIKRAVPRAEIPEKTAIISGLVLVPNVRDIGESARSTTG